jgi:phosphopantothenoylcysteine decarboxylase/phosphopantothenate--cysteine ligase
MSRGNLLFCLTGSIACYKACGAISRLTQEGLEVQTVATAAALRFVGESTLEGLSGRPVFTDLWESGRALDHIEVARKADLALVCPASANAINGFAAGLAGDVLGTLFLAWEFPEKPWWIAPAMNARMWSHPATQASVERLRSWKVRILDSAEGPHACGEAGPGRLAEPEAIVAEVLAYFGTGGASPAAKK